jgi:hypothetical protein
MNRKQHEKRKKSYKEKIIKKPQLLLKQDKPFAKIEGMVVTPT